MGSTVFERQPHASTIKALLVNNAKQYTFTGTTSDLSISSSNSAALAALAEAHKLYRCHDRLLEHKAALFEHLTARWRDLFAAIEHAGVRPGVAPVQPAAGAGAEGTGDTHGASS